MPHYIVCRSETPVFKKLNPFLNSVSATIAIGACNIIDRIHTVQSWARDNVTALSGHKVVGYCIFTIFVVATLSRHRNGES